MYICFIANKIIDIVHCLSWLFWVTYTGVSSKIPEEASLHYMDT